MAERRDTPPAQVPRAPVISPVAGRLSPVQEAWGAYVEHGLSCPRCRSLDGGACDDAARLHGAYQAADKAAHDRFVGDTP